MVWKLTFDVTVSDCELIFPRVIKLSVFWMKS